MVRRRRHVRPTEWLTTGVWPQGHLALDAPPEARVARAIAIELNHVLLGRSLRALAADADLAHTTIYDLLAGKTYGDVITVARLEAALDRSLWPDRSRDFK